MPRGLGCACGNPCDHGFRGVTGRIGFHPGLGELVEEGVNPWDTSRWTITEYAAAAGLVLSVVWIWQLTKGK